MKGSNTGTSRIGSYHQKLEPLGDLNEFDKIFFYDHRPRVGVFKNNSTRHYIGPLTLKKVFEGVN